MKQMFNLVKNSILLTAFLSLSYSSCAPNCEEGATGTMQDEAGKVYKTVCINGQNWMAENLMSDKVDHYSVSYDNNNDEKYGYKYTFNNALKACPDGWILPSKNDYEKLIDFIGGPENYGSLILDESNTTGFSAIFSGFIYPSGSYLSLESSPILIKFWTSTPAGDSEAYSFNAYHAFIDRGSTGFGHSVRCIEEN